ncbi:MAG: hypothetical protein ED557_02620 [Balneola sp.]|nr:MAG: hypothetical protein ED557_02620 [Balneola sp.]
MNFLRKLRRDNADGGSITTYLLYGIGEIILVVIGILIAVSINNWNEEKKSQKELLNIYTIVKADLENDIADINRILGIHQETRHLYGKVLGDSLAKQDYALYPRAAFLIMGYPEFSMDKRGISLLGEFRSNSEHIQDTLMTTIIDFYSERTLEIEVDDKFRAMDFEDNYMHWKNNYEWWQGYILRTDFTGFLEYATTDSDYKNRVANFYFLTYDIFLPELVLFKNGALEIISTIDNRMRDS